ncbi:hypothetical protein ABPG75_003039 [Micractinium tetrahymenae]
MSGSDQRHLGGSGGGDALPPLRLLPGRRGSGVLQGALAANGSSAAHTHVQVLEAAAYAGGSTPKYGSSSSVGSYPGSTGRPLGGGTYPAIGHALLAQQFEQHEAQYEAQQQQQKQHQQQHQQQQQRFVVDPEEGRAAGRARAAAAAGGGSPATPATLRRNSRLALLSMLLLVFQGTALSIMLRYSRARAGQPYLASVSVIFTEAIKLVICVFMQYRVVAAEVASALPRTSGGSGAGAAARGAPLSRELRRQARDIAAKSVPMLLPAAMFVMQQVLLIIAATHLDAVAFQIFSQSFKLVPTALFAYWLLGQMLEPMQWASIPVLAFGVILVTVNNGSPQHGHRSAAAAAAMSSSHGLDYVAGMVACSVSGLSSAYAGVYFEKYVKGKHAASLWVRNIQLGIYGVPLSTAYALLKDGWQIHVGGLMQGFDAATWMVIALQARTGVFGGLVTGMVVKYCDNILKNFALAISVILTVLVAIPLFGQWPSPIFLVGVSLVLLSVFMYGRALDARKLQLLWQRARKVSWAETSAVA